MADAAPAAPSPTAAPAQPQATSNTSATPRPVGGTSMSTIPELATGASATTKSAEGAENAADDAAFWERLGKVDKKEVFKRLGLKTKANGKEVPLDDLDKVTRYVQRGLVPEQSLEELAKARSQVEPIQQLLQTLQDGDEGAKEKTLEQLLPPEVIDRIAEQRLMRKIQAQAKYDGLSPDARRYAEEADQLRAQTEAFKAQQAEQQRQAQMQAEQREVLQYRSELADVAGKTLEALGLPAQSGALGPVALSLLQPMMRAAINAGVKLDPGMLAEKADAQLSAIHEWKMGGLIKDWDKPEAKWSGDKLEAYLGKPVIRALLHHLQQKAGRSTQQQQPKTVTQPAAQPQKWDPRKLW